MNLEPKDIIQIILTIISIIVAIRIPVEISLNQRYENMAATYQSIEFAAALQNVISFYYHVCQCDDARIPAEYRRIFFEDFPDGNSLNHKGDNTNILHYQRRFLTDFFCEMAFCARSSRRLKKRISEEYTKSESSIIRILIFMNKANESDKTFFDISPIFHQHYGRVKGINKYLSNLASLLEKSDRQMK